MLGIAKDTMPSLADITAAADRYGLKLDQLGDKVRQLSITEAASQIVKDFELLMLAGADAGVVIEAMSPKIQKIATDALKFGLQLPLSMKPVLDEWLKSGKAVDENGKKLEDLSRFNFAKPIEDMIEALIKKLDELIAKFLEVGNTRVKPPYIPPPGGDEGEGGEGGDSGPGGRESAFMIGGPRFPGFGASRSSASVIQITVISELDGREVARNQIEHLPSELMIAGK
jgi:hypothetical protein